MTASLFFIPIQLAAYKSEYFMMNHIILLMCSSWAYHSLCHEYKHLPESIYFYLDKMFCYTLGLHGVIMTMNKIRLYHPHWEKIINSPCPKLSSLHTNYANYVNYANFYNFYNNFHTLVPSGLCENISRIQNWEISFFSNSFCSVYFSERMQMLKNMGIGGIFILSSGALVVFYVEGVRKNKNYHLRGWKHWRYHIPHMMMHLSATICLCMAILL